MQQNIYENNNNIVCVCRMCLCELPYEARNSQLATRDSREVNGNQYGVHAHTHSHAHSHFVLLACITCICIYYIYTYVVE